MTSCGVRLVSSRSFWRTRFESVPLNAVQNLSFDSGDSIGVMKIMLARDAVAVGMGAENAGALSARLKELLPLIQELAQGLEGENPTT